MSHWRGRAQLARLRAHFLDNPVVSIGRRDPPTHVVVKALAPGASEDGVIIVFDPIDAPPPPGDVELLDGLVPPLPGRAWLAVVSTASIEEVEASLREHVAGAVLAHGRKAEPPAGATRPPAPTATPVSRPSLPRRPAPPPEPPAPPAWLPPSPPTAATPEVSASPPEAPPSPRRPSRPPPSRPPPSRPPPSRPAPSRPAPSRPAPSRPAPSRPAPSRPAPEVVPRPRVSGGPEPASNAPPPFLPEPTSSEPRLDAHTDRIAAHVEELGPPPLPLVPGPAAAAPDLPPPPEPPPPPGLDES